MSLHVSLVRALPLHLLPSVQSWAEGRACRTVSILWGRWELIVSVCAR
jgi:hypothetical protein